MTYKTIQISGYESDQKTVFWINGNIEVALNYDISDYVFSDDEIESELIKCQNKLNQLAEDNQWVYTPKAFINEFEVDEENEKA